MSDLTDFLLARIAEDEAVARDATAGPWGFDSIGTVWSSDDAEQVATCGAYRWEMDPLHIARHDPARVLAECEAKRRIMALDDSELADSPPYNGALSDVYRELALPYADHPDYREEWRP